MTDKSARPTNWRWAICTLLFFATTINYLDRQVLSLTWKDFIAPEFHWTDSDYGDITGFFSLFYAAVSLSPASSSTGPARGAAMCGLSSYGRLQLVCMRHADGPPCI